MKKRKLTWENIYKDFRTTYPSIAKEVLGFEPHSFATILLFFRENKRMLYNYDTKELIALSK